MLQRPKKNLRFVSCICFERTRIVTFCQGTVASDKHEILFGKFKINYNNEAEIFKKGTVLYRQTNSGADAVHKQTGVNQIPSINDDINAQMIRQPTCQDKKLMEAGRCSARAKTGITAYHVDLIQEKFWSERQWLLSRSEL